MVDRAVSHLNSRILWAKPRESCWVQPVRIDRKNSVIGLSTLVAQAQLMIPFCRAFVFSSTAHRHVFEVSVV
jgi:hypothetical protein